MGERVGIVGKNGRESWDSWQERERELGIVGERVGDSGEERERQWGIPGKHTHHISLC